MKSSNKPVYYLERIELLDTFDNPEEAEIRRAILQETTEDDSIVYKITKGGPFNDEESFGLPDSQDQEYTYPNGVPEYRYAPENEGGSIRQGHLFGLVCVLILVAALCYAILQA